MKPENWDFGYYGKGLDGYAHYTTDHPPGGGPSLLDLLIAWLKKLLR